MKDKLFLELSVQISSDNRGSRYRSLHIAVCDGHGNLNTFAVQAIVCQRLAEIHGGNILAEDVLLTVTVGSQIQPVLPTIISICSVLPVGSHQRALIGRSVGGDPAGGPELACHSQQCLAGVVNGLEDSLVFLIIHRRSVKGNSYGNEQHGSYCQSQQQFDNGKTSFVYSVSHLRSCNSPGDSPGKLNIVQYRARSQLAELISCPLKKTRTVTRTKSLVWSPTTCSKFEALTFSTVIC